MLVQFERMSGSQILGFCSYVCNPKCITSTSFKLFSKVCLIGTKISKCHFWKFGLIRRELLFISVNVGLIWYYLYLSKPHLLNCKFACCADGLGWWRRKSVYFQIQNTWLSGAGNLVFENKQQNAAMFTLNLKFCFFFRN